MKHALAATRAALTWIALVASLVTGSALVATPASAATQTWTASTSVNLRTGPSTSKTIVAQLQAGDSVLAAGNPSGDWLPVKYNGGTAYAWAEYLDPNTNGAVLLTTGPVGRRSASKNVNVRATASLDAPVTAILTKGTAIKVTGLSSGDFAQVTVDAKTQWVHARFLSSATDTTPDVVASYTTTGNLALRTTASVAATNQGTIKAGSTVGTTGTHSAGYSQVVYSGKVGWVITGYLKAVAGTAANLVLPMTAGARYARTDGVVLRANPAANADAVGTLDQGAVIRVTGPTKDDFSQVIWNGGTAWVATASISTTRPTTDLGSDSLNKLEPYAKAAVLEVRANFPQIKTIYGWRSGSAYSSDHPNGRAIDNMIPSYKANKALGDALAQYFIDNGKRLHVTYVIWRQRNYRITRGYWVKMADRGGDTANHMDHVHVSFDPS